MLDSKPATLSVFAYFRQHTLLGLFVFSALIVSGCQNLNQTTHYEQRHPSAQILNQESLKLDSNKLPSWLASVDTEQNADIWQRIRQGFQLQSQFDKNPRIDHQRLWFASRGRSIEIMSERSAPYMHYIVESLEERNMPLELALLPMIESAYDPLAYSRAHASGLWQFIPSTGRHFNLKQSHWYDARRDITASTQAALNYLEYLNEMFDGDWLLALAAYNAGEGTVARAIKRNEARGLPTDYWNLNLPKETQAYVPKLLAVSQLINSPTAYSIALHPVANEPYFTKIPLKQQMAITRLAQLAKIKEDKLLKLNPAYKQGITLDGPKHLLVPLAQAELLSTQLASLKPSEHVQWQQYTVRRGDNLSSIARRHKVPMALVKDMNTLSGSFLRIGQVLNIPKPNTAAANYLAQQSSTSNRTILYKVRAGDSLSKIAAQQKVSVAQLKRWNNLSSNALKIGQTLSIASNSHATPNAKTVNYRVRPGDSLYAIAKRHSVSLKQLKNWNPKISSALQPGQMLSLQL